MTGLVELRKCLVDVVDGAGLEESREGIEEALWSLLGVKELSLLLATVGRLWLVARRLLLGLVLDKGRPVTSGSVEVEGKLDLEDESEPSSFLPFVVLLLLFVWLSRFELCVDSKGFGSFLLFLI